MEEQPDKGQLKEKEQRARELSQKWSESLFILSDELGKLINPNETVFQLYFPILGAILDFADFGERQGEVEEFRNKVYQEKNVNQEVARERAWELVTIKPLEGKRVLEIGGPFVQALHLLGAKEAVCIDSASKWPYSPERGGYKRIFDRLDFTDPQELVRGEFDLVLTREVLSRSSQLTSRTLTSGKEIWTEEFKYGGRRGWSEEEAIQGMLRACAQLTKKGGLNIHAGDIVAQPEDFYDAIGLELIAKIRINGLTTFVFRKK